MIGQREQQIGRSGEARARRPVRSLHHFFQASGHRLLLAAMGHLKGQGQHIGSLKFFFQLAGFIAEEREIGLANLLIELCVVRVVCGLSEDRRDPGDNAAGVGKVGGGHPFALQHPAHEILVRGAPVAKLEGQAPNAPVLAKGKQARPALTFAEEPLHHRIAAPQQLLIAAGQVFRPGHQHAGVAPAAGGALFPVILRLGAGHGQGAALGLLST